MKWKVLLSAPYIIPVVDRFRPVFAEKGIDLTIPPVNERLSEEELLQWISDIDGAICGDDCYTKKVLAAAPKLKVISKWGTGVDSIDLENCARRGIVVCNTPNAFTEPVADSVLGYILCFARQLLGMDREMKIGKWEKIPGKALRELTLGVIGVGNVGKAVAKRSISFGMRVLGNDLVKMPDKFLAESGCQMVSKEELLREADFVSLNCNLNPSSYHLMNAHEFSTMKSSAYVINTARGPIIDETSLVKALQNKCIAGAALDVFEVEPLPLDSPLREIPNVLLAPHNSNSSPEAWERVHLNTLNNLFEVLNGFEK